jgi:hypothetical protein
LSTTITLPFSVTARFMAAVTLAGAVVAASAPTGIRAKSKTIASAIVKILFLMFSPFINPLPIFAYRK